MHKRLTRSLLAVMVATALIAACGDDDAADPGATTSSSNSPSSTSPSTTSPSTTSPSTTSPSGTSTTSDVVTIGDDQDHRVTESTATIHCDDGGDIDIVEDGATVTVTGRCEDIDLPASNVQLSVEVAEDIDVDGSRNTVEATEIDGLDVDGDANTVTLGSVREIDVEGNDNEVTFGAGNPDIDDDGRGNTIAAG